MFRTEDISKFEKAYGFGSKNIRPSRRHELACREVAEALWRSSPKLTIPQISKRNEIINVCEGKKYAEKTIRKWIKDLNPNPLPVIGQ
ncbi:MAG: hypothetical protein GY786_01425 [Proteobacteria bacterium]|nr:hypothetical protein [Pseudomonadota bacterium]